MIDMSRELIGKNSIKFDNQTNKIVITLPEGNEIEISPSIMREFLPIISEEEKVKELFMMIHDLEKERLTKMTFYTKKMTELEDGIKTARTELEKCEKMMCIKKWQAVIKSYVDEKNTLAEIRRSVGLIDKTLKKPLEVRIAALGHNPNDYI